MYDAARAGHLPDGEGLRARVRSLFQEAACG